MLRVWLEAGVVGVTLAVALWLVALVAPRWLSTPGRVALTGLVVGVLFHLGFEATGLNRAYCASGHACQQRRWK